ncbi:MAG: hypothetical protein QG623_396 [Patescibacteria group bacterium]|nr:hypothetical protein [Patescibacteria group bacterium]
MPQGSTKRKSSTSGRHRSGGSGSSTPQYRPGVHPIIPTKTSDQVKRPNQESVPPQVDPKIEQQEMLEALDSGSKAPDQFTPKDDVIDKYVEENLGLSDPDTQPTQQTGSSTSFTPSIGRPEKSTTSNSKGGSSSTGSDSKSTSESTKSDEKQSLSDIINKRRDDLIKPHKDREQSYKKSRFGKFNFVGRGRSKVKRIVIASVVSAFAAGAVAIVGVLPSAIESILTGATTSYSNFSTEAIIKKVFNDYFKEDVLVAKCRERGGTGEKCNVGVSRKDGLFGRAREDMRANKMDKRLADKGISWDYRASDDTYTFFRTKDGSPITEHQGLRDLDMFALGRNEGSKYIDSLVRTEINNTSRWKKYFIRGPTLRAMRTRTGSTGCFFLCKSKDSFNNTKKWPKKAFARFVKQHLLWSSSQLLSGIVDCIIGGGDACASRTFHNYARGKVGSAAARLFSQEFASEVLEAFDGAVEKGVTRYVLEEALKKLFDYFGKTISDKAASGVLAVVLIIKAIGELASNLQALPKILRIKNMMLIAATSATFMIMINEARRGTMPLGDFGAMLSSFIGMGRSRIFASMFMGPDNKTALNGQPYSCNNAEDGGVAAGVSELISPAKMEAGDLTCKSFMLDFEPDILKNPLIQVPANAWNAVKAICLPANVLCVSDAINFVDKIQQFLGDITNMLISMIPGFDKFQELINSKLEPFASSILGAISPSIVTDAFAGVTSKISPEGARVFDALSGGASSINQYLTPRDELGGGVLDLTAQAELDAEIAQQQAQDIKYASRYDRFFNLDPTTGVGTSLLTQLSASTPANFNVASIFNPMQNLSLAFNNSTGKATYADNSSIARTVSTAFAVPVRGHALTKIKGIAKGTIPIEDPESEKCIKEKATWKQQIEDRTDSSKSDQLGFGMPDGDGSGTSPCLLADTSLKVLTTHRTDTDDFPYGSENVDGDDGSGGGGGGGGNNDEPVVGDTSDVECKAGSNDAGEAEGWLKGKKYSIRLCTVNGFTSASDEDGGLARFNSTVSANVVGLVAAAKAAGKTTSVTSSFRSYAKQAELYACAPGCTNGNPAARPGNSNHQMGFAFDIGMNSNSPFNLWMRTNGSNYGYKWIGSNDPPHFSVDGN